ncbi:MAG: nitrilase-related carbon-nitrogen hydrolase [Candidatus Kapaibacterium sp.]
MNEEHSTGCKVGVVQFAPILADVEANLQLMRRLTDREVSDILVFPELASTGYFFPEREELVELSEEPESGRFCSWVRTLAVEHSTVVVAGFSERAGDSLYNSALIAFPDQSYRVYRKTHLFYRERELFQPGDSGFFVVEWEGVRIGTMICYDWRFPESARTLALMGADIIVHPSNLVAAKHLWGPTMQTRSFENKVITATANRYGKEERGGECLVFSGASQIVDMNGKVVAEAGVEEDRLIVAEVIPQKTRTKEFNRFNDLFGDRRPEMYKLR